MARYEFICMLVIKVLSNEISGSVKEMIYTNYAVVLNVIFCQSIILVCLL